MSASFLLTNPLELRVVGDGVSDGGGGDFEGGASASASVAKVEASGEWRLASGENRSGSGPKPPPRRKRASGPTRSGTGGRRRLRKLTPLGPLALSGVRRAALLLGVRESERSAASGEQGSARRRAASGRSSPTRSDIFTVSDFQAATLVRRLQMLQAWKIRGRGVGAPDTLHTPHTHARRVARNTWDSTHGGLGSEPCATDVLGTGSQGAPYLLPPAVGP